jgi:hypothetical protein
MGPENNGCFVLIQTYFFSSQIIAAWMWGNIGPPKKMITKLLNV